MSFDSTFSFSGAITAIDGIISDINDEIAANVATIAMCTSLEEGFCEQFAICEQSEALALTNTKLANVITYLQALSSMISALGSLDNTAKATLYSLYTNHPLAKVEYMAKLIYNHAAMVTDYDIISAANISNSEKDLLVNLLYKKYPVYYYNTNWFSKIPLDRSTGYYTAINAGFV